MPNIATALKEEISRLARREIRRQTSVLKKASAQYRRDIAEMKRRIAEFQRKVSFLERQVQKELSTQPAEVDIGRVRFAAKGLRSHRQRLGLSAADYGALIGVTDQTIYNWEHEQARPRQEQLTRIAALRRMGKREARGLLEQMGHGVRRKPK